jgi:hypothetical protein
MKQSLNTAALCYFCTIYVLEDVIHVFAPPKMVGLQTMNSG